MDSEPKPNISRREELAGKHDSKSVSLKFEMLLEATKKDLDDALNKVGLEFKQCFTENYLNTLSPEQKQELSSLNGNLILSTNSRTPNKETIQAIVKILNS
jgi:hypothetical protein